VSCHVMSGKTSQRRHQIADSPLLAFPLVPGSSATEIDASASKRAAESVKSTQSPTQSNSVYAVWTASAAIMILIRASWGGNAKPTQPKKPWLPCSNEQILNQNLDQERLSLNTVSDVLCRYVLLCSTSLQRCACVQAHAGFRAVVPFVGNERV
jgi:hypothetical protein